MHKLTAHLAAIALAAAAVTTAAPAHADETTPIPDPITMGTTVSQVWVGPTPEPFVYSETLTLDPPVAQPAATVTEGVVTYRGRTRRAVCVDAVVYLARTGRRLGPRAAATFRAQATR